MSKVLLVEFESTVTGARVAINPQYVMQVVDVTDEPELIGRTMIYLPDGIQQVTSVLYDTVIAALTQGSIDG